MIQGERSEPFQNARSQQCLYASTVSTSGNDRVLECYKNAIVIDICPTSSDLRMVVAWEETSHWCLTSFLAPWHSYSSHQSSEDPQVSGDSRSELVLM